MNTNSFDQVGRALLTTPSFYALVAFVPSWMGYLSDMIHWDSASLLAQSSFGVFVVTLVVATVLHVRLLLADPIDLESFSVPRSLVIWLGLVGLAGCLIYLRDMAAKFGGLGILWILYTGDPLAIREAQQDFSSIGTQLSYFGWVSAGLAAVRLGQGRGGFSDTALIVVQALMNVVFIDRTRPIWVIFTCVIAFIISRRSLSVGTIGRTLGIVGILGVGFFVGFSMLTGKVVEDRGDPFRDAIFSLVYYFTNAFPYLAHIIDQDGVHDYVPKAILTPLFQALAPLGLVDPPPPRILPFLNVPFSTNVGTGLEPFFNDGGFAYLCLGMIVYSFGLNAIGTWMLRHGGALGLIAWAHTCFTAFMCFFTPKINSAPYWLMLIIGFSGFLLQRSRLLHSRGQS